MKRPAMSAVVVLCLAGALAPGVLVHTARAAKLPRATATVDSVVFLPETTIMVRVADRVVRADDFRVRYYDLAAGDRPSADSAGRTEFLNTLADKEILGLVARKINPQLEVEQRAEMRRTTNTALQNMLFQTMVMDSIEVTEQEVAAAIPQWQHDVRIRELLFEDRDTAERVRRDLLRGKIGWKEAYRRHAIVPDTGDGTVGWIKRSEAPGEFGLKLFTAPVGGYCEIIQDQNGFHLVQVLERRPAWLLAIVPMRRMIIRDLADSKSAPRTARMYAMARQRAGAVYDSTNLRWVAGEFRRDITSRRVPLGGIIAINRRIPNFAPADLKRVLIRDKTRQFTLSQFLEGYQAIPPVMRRRILSLEPLIFYADAMFLEPVLVEMARARGVDKDPRTIAIIEERREKLMVERVYQDSIMSRVKVDPSEVRRYYDEHPEQFTKKLRAHYAAIMRFDKHGIDSVKAALDAGAKPEAIVAADRLAGSMSSLVAWHEEGGPSPYGKIILEELRPGHSTLIGPDSEGKYLIISVLQREEQHVQTFQEAEAQALDGVRDQKGNAILQEFLDRHRSAYRVETHPERVMAVRFTDPILD